MIVFANGQVLRWWDIYNLSAGTAADFFRQALNRSTTELRLLVLSLVLD